MTWAVAGAVAGIVGVATSVAGLVASGEAAQNAASYQAQVAHNNAITAEQNARYAQAAGEAETLNAGLKGAAKVGAVKTAIAANNIDVNSGSAVDVLAGDTETARLDQLTTANNAALKVYGYRTQGAGYTSQAGLLQNEADSIPGATALSAAGTLLGGASSIGFKWQQMQDTGSGWKGVEGSGFTASGLD